MGVVEAPGDGAVNTAEVLLKLLIEPLMFACPLNPMWVVPGEGAIQTRQPTNLL